MPCGVGDYTAPACLRTWPTVGIDVHVLTKRELLVRPVAVDEHFSFTPTYRPGLWVQAGLYEKVQALRPDIISVQYPASFGRGNR